MLRRLEQVLKSDWLLYSIVGLAVIVRLLQYVYNRSFWLDESFLALNLRERDLMGMFTPLNYDQGAPLGFLVPSKILYDIFGEGEWVMRFLPLIASFLTIYWLWHVLKIVYPQGLGFGLVIFATTPTFIYYSSEFKQYSFDMMFAVGIVLFALRLLDDWTIRKIQQATWMGALVVCFSHPSIFVLAGVGIVLFIIALQRKQNELAIVGMGVVWLISFGIVYFGFYRALQSNDYLISFWQEAFLRLDLYSFVYVIAELFSFLGGFYNTGIIVLLLVGFLLGLLFTKKNHLVLLLMPLFVTIFASILGQYPFRGRLIFFLLPIPLIISTVGLVDFILRIYRGARIFGVSVGILMVIALLARIDVRQEYVELRSVVSELNAHIDTRVADISIVAQDPIHVALRWYDVDYPIYDRNQLITQPTWIILGNYPSSRTATQLEIERLENIGTIVERIEVTGIIAIKVVP